VGSVRDDEGRSPGEKPGPVAPDARWVYIHEKDVERVEIHRSRGNAVSAEKAAELARRLRSSGDPVGLGVAERLDRGVLTVTAVIGTSRPEAVATLRTIEQWAPERLRVVAEDLRDYLLSEGVSSPADHA
jgi:hypothetical protein